MWQTIRASFNPMEQTFHSDLTGTLKQCLNRIFQIFSDLPFSLPWGSSHLRGFIHKSWSCLPAIHDHLMFLQEPEKPHHHTSWGLNPYNPCGDESTRTTTEAPKKARGPTLWRLLVWVSWDWDKNREIRRPCQEWRANPSPPRGLW